MHDGAANTDTTTQTSATAGSRPLSTRKRVTRVVWAGAGFLSFGCAVLGAVLPLIPTVPFLLLCAFCFARSSERVERWFHSTKLYNSVLKDYVSRREMTMKAKLKVVIPSTLMILVASFFVPVTAVRIVMYVVLVGHLVYFFLKVPTITNASPAEAA
jgi:hypothetical protein